MTKLEAIAAAIDREQLRRAKEAADREVREARDRAELDVALPAARRIARAAFGDDVIDHYVHQARIEVEAFDAAVTDWERVRGFERL